MYKLLGKIWGILQSGYKWHLLWLFHDKFMIGVSGIIFDKNGFVLLLRHRFWKKDSWGLPSGYMEKREKLEDAVKREIEEETKLNVTIGPLINLNSGFKLRIECSYIGYCEDSSTLSVNQDEILEARFFSIDNLPKGLLDTHVKLIALATQHKNLN